MNKANKITMSRIILSVIILIILLFPFHQIGIDMPSYIVNGNISGVKVSDRLDKQWYIDLAKKRINDKFGKMLD